jgi:hypothetical protein
MKKTQFMTVLLGVSTIFAASAKSFTVGVENHYTGEAATSFSLRVATTETQTSMCALQVTKVEITNPPVPFGAEIPVKELKLEFGRNHQSMCLMAFGPHHGVATLDIGSALPKVLGVYNLIINGEDYGLIRIGVEEGASLDLMAE